MKFMLIMNSPKDGYDQYMSWPKKILEANGAFMENFTKKLIDAGEFVDAAGLAVHAVGTQRTVQERRAHDPEDDRRSERRAATPVGAGAAFASTCVSSVSSVERSRRRHLFSVIVPVVASSV